MIPFEDFMPDLEPDLPLCPVPVIERRLREALIEACEDATLWRHEVPEIPVLAGVREYALEPPEGAQVHSVLAVHRGNPALCLASGRDFVVSRRGALELVIAPVRDSVALDSPSRTHRGLFVEVTLKPARGALEAPEVAWRDYHKLVVSGTLAGALRMKDQPWTDYEKGYEQRAIFEQEIAEVRRARERGHVTGNHRMRPGLPYAAPNRRRGYY